MSDLKFSVQFEFSIHSQWTCNLLKVTIKAVINYFPQTPEKRKGLGVTLESEHQPNADASNVSAGEKSCALWFMFEKKKNLFSFCK